MAGKLNGFQSYPGRDTIRDVYEREIVNSFAAARLRKHDSMRVHYILPFLSTTPHVEKLCKEVLHILDKSVLTHNARWNAGSAANAFLTMERYVLNILDHPWKQEFKKLKLYSGFFASRIHGFLEDAVRLFHMMGYMAGSGCLWMKEPAPRSTLVMIACDCFVASVECHIMQGILVRLERCVSIGDVYKARMECTGDEEKCAQWTKRNIGLKKKSQSLDDERRERDILRQDRRKEQEMYLRNYGGGCPVSRTIGTNRTSHISSSENQIHHILRSKENSEDPHLSRERTVHRSWDLLKSEPFSEERIMSNDVVKPLLEEKENRGNSYLHEKPSRDSGYNSKPSSKEISVQESPQLSVSSPDGLYGGDLQVDTEPDHIHHGLHELIIRDPHSPKSGNSSQPSPGADYLFEATVDDHIQKSLQYLKKKDSTVSECPLEEGKDEEEPGDEWAGVREKLRSDYGDSYFEGDRENVLNKTPNSSPSTDSLSYRSRPLMSKNVDDSPKAWTPSTGDEVEEDFDDENTNTVLRRPGISRQRLVNRTPTPPQTARTGSPYENVEEAAMKIIRSDSPPPEGEDPSGVSIRKQPSFKGYTFGKGKKVHVVPIKVDIPNPPEVNTGSPKVQPAREHSHHQSQAESQICKVPPPVKEKSAIVKRIVAARKVNRDGERKSLYDNVHMDPLPESPPPLSPGSISKEDLDDGSPPPYTFLHNAGAEPTSSSPSKNPDWQFTAAPHVPSADQQTVSLDQCPRRYITSDSAQDFGYGVDPKDREWACDETDGSPLWQCNSCTYANEDHDLVCQMCGKSREKGAEKVPLTSGGPHCPACTYVNKPGVGKCSMCDHELKGCPTYI